jgi:ABC-type sugar transport system permease subunit
MDQALEQTSHDWSKRVFFFVFRYALKKVVVKPIFTVLAGLVISGLLAFLEWAKIPWERFLLGLVGLLAVLVLLIPILLWKRTLDRRRQRASPEIIITQRVALLSQVENADGYP